MDGGSLAVAGTHVDEAEAYPSASGLDTAKSGLEVEKHGDRLQIH